jgi:hypothetical protein
VAVVAPPQDTAGALLDAQIATVFALAYKMTAAWTCDGPNVTCDNTTFTCDGGPGSYLLDKYQYLQQLNMLQVQAVDHYMVTGWLNAASILALYSAPPWDVEGQKITTRVAFLQNLYNNAVTAGMPAGNANGYGSSGWTTIASAFAQQLYAKQIELVEHIMNLPGGTSAATILANMTGVQTAPAGITFEYAFNSVGFTDAWIDD